MDVLGRQQQGVGYVPRAERHDLSLFLGQLGNVQAPVGRVVLQLDREESVEVGVLGGCKLAPCPAVVVDDVETIGPDSGLQVRHVGSCMCLTGGEAPPRGCRPPVKSTVVIAGPPVGTEAE